MRIGRLPAAAAALAQALAILGFEAELRHAAALAGLDASAAADAADALVAARIATRNGGLRFVHPLVGSVVYDAIPAARRSVEHKRAARFVDAGAHLLRVEPAGDPWVVERLREDAAAQTEASAVIPLLERALAEPPAPDAVGGLYAALGLAQATAGDPRGIGSLSARSPPAPSAGRPRCCSGASC